MFVYGAPGNGKTVISQATRNLLDSRPGRALRALKGGLEMAEAFGVNGARLKIIAFVYAALLACISGWLYAHLQRFINPTPFDLRQGIEYLFMAVVGGAGSVWGAIIGATSRACCRGASRHPFRTRRHCPPASARTTPLVRCSKCKVPARHSAASSPSTT